jgi:uncharacterized protein YbjT (DUF2867 family)
VRSSTRLRPFITSYRFLFRNLLAAACAGLDRLLLIPSSEIGPGRRAGQSLAAIDAAVAAGVGHIVLMSSAGTRAAEEPNSYASYPAALLAGAFPGR